MRGTSRVCQRESNGSSCDVDSDVFQWLIQCEGEGLLRSRISCSLKNCHLTELRERGEKWATYSAISILQTIVQSYKSHYIHWTVESYQSWSWGVKDNICGLRKLWFGNMNGLASRGQSYVFVVVKGSSSEGTTASAKWCSNEERHLWRSVNVTVIPTAAMPK